MAEITIGQRREVRRLVSLERAQARKDFAKSGNVARNKKLSKRRRREVAILAAKVRWSKPRRIKKGKK